MDYFLSYRKFLEDISSGFLCFFIIGKPFVFRMFDYLCRSLISELYHICPDLKSLFTVAECRLKC